MFCYKCLAEALEEEQKRHDELELAKKDKCATMPHHHAAAVALPATTVDAPPSAAEPPVAPEGDATKKQKSDT
jgi:hypothetical protein